MVCHRDLFWVRSCSIYINNLPKCLRFSTAFLLADDTSLRFNTLDNNHIKSEFDEIESWFLNNCETSLVVNKKGPSIQISSPIEGFGVGLFRPLY